PSIEQLLPRSLWLAASRNLAPDRSPPPSWDSRASSFPASMCLLSSEGSLEPQIEDLIHRINELQQAKKRSSVELGEAQALQEAMNQELDSLNDEKAHLEEVLGKKQEALMILQKHCQERE
ncbi:hypothetical protein U0070_018864, partial [Myodes glareolus]